MKGTKEIVNERIMKINIQIKEKKQGLVQLHETITKVRKRKTHFSKPYRTNSIMEAEIINQWQI